MTTSGRGAMTPAPSVAAGSSTGTSATDAIYRSLFESFTPDSGGRISPQEVLARLERCGLRADDPRIAEALAVACRRAGCTAAEAADLHGVAGGGHEQCPQPAEVDAPVPASTLESVRRVTEENAGRNTPGIDGRVVFTTRREVPLILHEDHARRVLTQ